MRQLKPSRVLENKPSGQVGPGEAQDVLKGQASGLRIGLLPPLFPSPPRGGGSLSIAQETWSGLLATAAVLKTEIAAVTPSRKQLISHGLSTNNDGSCIANQADFLMKIQPSLFLNVRSLSSSCT